MRIDQFAFGSFYIDGLTYEHDVVIARGRVRKRKKPSKPFRDPLATHPTLRRGGHPMGLPAPGGGYGHGRRSSRDGRGQGRGRSSRGGVGDRPDP
jgi:hypothetical protein